MTHGGIGTRTNQPAPQQRVRVRAALCPAAAAAHRPVPLQHVQPGEAAIRPGPGQHRDPAAHDRRRGAVLRLLRGAPPQFVPVLPDPHTDTPKIA